MMFGYATNRPQVSSIDEESPIAARVCVVDDDVSVRESLELLIRTAGSPSSSRRRRSSSRSRATLARAAWFSISRFQD
jgi:hypothetical protein